MPMLKQPSALYTIITLSLSLAACHSPQDSGNNAADNQAATQTGMTGGRSAAKVAALNVADGIDVCFRAIGKHLAPNTNVSEINSFFSSGKEIDGDADKPKGEATVCSVQYQDPNNPKKLVESSLDLETGEFSQPRPVEIRVTGGSAASFNLNDYLIPFSKVNAAGVTAFMETQKADMAKAFSKYAWSGLRLSSPDFSNKTHVLRLDVEGRLASNDIKESGYAELMPDGKTVVRNFLKPR